ncbi:serine/threonine protein kinase [Aquabacterium sp.]|uniref:serine/threonine protein kinase n=1 Tax=Aquabacterium sp. TaxID=1872578 RepID=UPI0025C6BF91|nr:serine/threonine protein kinase [Aquabacterium sp.]
MPDHAPEDDFPAQPAEGARPSAAHGLTPYATLTPERVLDTLDALGQPVDGRLLQLNSYENRVFQVGLDDGSQVVAKFYRSGRWTNEQILEEHAFALELAAAEVPAVPPLTLALDTFRLPAGLSAAVHGAPPTLGAIGDARVAVSPRRGGRTPELEDPAVLEWLGRFLGRLHTVGARQPFVHRPTLGVAQTGRAARDWLAEADHLPAEHRQDWLDAADEALDAAEEAFSRIDGLRLRRLHGDCHPGNLLWTPEGPHFVDLDDACMGPAVQDLWMLFSGDPKERTPLLHALLDGYEQVAEFDWRELRLIEPLRTLRLVHHSAWLARRWDDPAFPAAFPWYGSGVYWQQQANALRQQTEAMANPDDTPAWLQG